MMSLLNNAPLHYPSAIEWMWNYCIYLGPFTCSEGHNYDLGIYIDINKEIDYYSVSNASVYGDTPGNYLSGVFTADESYCEAIRRAKLLKIIPEDYIPKD